MPAMHNLLLHINGVLRLYMCLSAACMGDRSSRAVLYMECLATWNEDSENFLFARLRGFENAASDEEEYRCFVSAPSAFLPHVPFT